MAALYSEVLLDHYRNPRNYGGLPAPDVSYEEFNPLCGDRVRMELRIREGRIEAARFVGDGCAICIAAASILTELIGGAEIDDNQVISEAELLSSLKSEIKPARLKCAYLPLAALRSGIKIYNAHLR
ncbi:MAG: iron-sulfur cluster assembly scaffold protein [Acidobacteria bacterium]|nr:iron-sulfur cluster assembly scaffold protein [Acidobacteriota bacterium]